MTTKRGDGDGGGDEGEGEGEEDGRMTRVMRLGMTRRKR